MEKNVREALDGMADEVAAPQRIPDKVARRARRRMAASAGMALAMATALVFGSVTVWQMLRERIPMNQPGRGILTRPSDSAQKVPSSEAVGVPIGLREEAVGGQARIAFLSDRETPGQFLEIYVMGTQGDGQQRLTSSPLRLEGTSVISWSPDGTKLAFDVGLGEGASAIDVIDLEAGVRTRMVEDDTGNNPQGPSWSPDGRRIAFYDANGDIFLIGADASGLTRVTSSGPAAGHLYPAWDPTGQAIAFSCDCGTDSGIYVVGSDGTGVRRLTFGEDLRPAWSPDGARIAFARSDADWQVYVVDSGGSDEVQLTQLGGFAPTWSPDGTTIAFEGTRDGNQDIYVIAPDGTGEHRLTENGATELAVAWR
jgi:Tol biopolymer transport system component